MLIALNISGVLAYKGIDIQGVGLLLSPQAFVFYAGLLSAILLKKFKVRGGILISIAIAAVIAHLLGIGSVVEPVKFQETCFQLSLH